MSQPRILLVADDSRWIFNRHCQEISKRLNHYKFHISYKANLRREKKDFFNQFDVIYILDARMNVSYGCKDRTVIGIRSEFDYADHGEEWYYRNRIEKMASAFHVVNKRQYDVYSKYATIPIVFAPHGVDVSLFDSGPSDRKKMTVGINGNRNSGGQKGFDLVSKACSKIGVELIVAEQNMNRGHLTKEQMPEYYKKIDVYCNMSVSEGLNNSIMEAGAMSRIVIATPVGGAPEMIIHKKTGIICERNEGKLSEYLNFCYINLNNVRQYGMELRLLIREKWNWDICVSAYDELFKKVLK